MPDDLIRLSASEAVARLRRKEVSPLELIDAAAARIAAVDGTVNALPTLCLDRARVHARDLMAGRRREAENEPGWLAGLPVAIKDLVDVAGVRTTYGSPIFRDHVPEASHPLVERIERKGGIVIAKSNTPEFGAGGSTFNEVFGRTRNPWNTALTPGGSTGGGAAALSNNLFAPLSVQGPMARNIADLALFLDTMVGLCPRDPLTFEAPGVSFASAVAAPVAPKRVAFTADFGGKVPVDRETREICAAAMYRFADLGAVVEEASPDLGNIDEAFLTLRSQHYVVDRELMLQTHRDLIKPDIVWNTERGLKQSPSQIAAAERERAALFRRCAQFFATWDLLVTPGASTPAFDVNLRMPASIDGKKLEHYLGASLITAATTIMGLPSIAVPCGFDQWGRPVGLQIVGRHRGEAALLQAAALFESATGLAQRVPIDPRSGIVPPLP